MMNGEKKKKTIDIGMVFHKDIKNVKSIYIGRGRNNLGYGNPYTVEKWGRKKAIKKYKKYIEKNIEILTPLKELYKHNNLFLKCWCKREINGDVQCHGDVIKKILIKS